MPTHEPRWDHEQTASHGALCQEPKTEASYHVGFQHDLRLGTTLAAGADGQIVQGPGPWAMTAFRSPLAHARSPWRVAQWSWSVKADLQPLLGKGTIEP